MNGLQYTSAFALLFLMGGCMGSPTISKTQMKTVKLADNKSYKVPVGALYPKSPVTPQAINFYKVMGVISCKNGDITWEDPSIANKINKIMRGGTREEGIIIYVKAAEIGKIGFASPLK